MSVGPWGGQDGYRWDDGVHSGIRQLVIAHGAVIDSIRIEYDDKGTSVWSEKHGGSGGPKTDQVKLDYPNEYLTSIQGHYSSLNERGPVSIRSLSFTSNKKTYGPYGIEQGTCFSFPKIGGRIVGFHGKCGWYLDALGAYLEPHLPRTNPLNPIVQSHCFASGTESYGYSVVQGSLGNNYDVILAFRQKNEYSYQPPNNYGYPSPNNYGYQLPNNLPRQSSGSEESSDSDSDAKVSRARILSKPIKKYPSDLDKRIITYGAWGGNGGTMFDDGVHTGVKQILLSRNVGIVSIRVQYDQDGEDIWGSKNGGTGGFKSERITFDYPCEILTHISGYYGPAMIMGPTVIRSLSFHTTKTKYGPFGEEQGQHFTTNLKEGKIVGFHGRKGLFLDAIGVHVMEGKVTLAIRQPSDPYSEDEKIKGKVTSPTLLLPARPPSNPSGQSEVSMLPSPVRPSSSIPTSQSEVPANDTDKPRWSSRLALPRRAHRPTDEVVQRVVKEPALCETGPWGGEGGRPWDDGVFLGIKQIYLTRNEAISSIQIEYDLNGQSVWSVKHGGDGVGTPTAIKLDYPHEVLTCLSGFYGPINGDYGPRVIKSLTFTTSRKKYGPYGEEVGTFFSSIKTEGKVVGFHGRGSIYLDAIGVHMQH
ncbi:unnamed protein product, partial [Thlaspi arvense]